MISFFKKLREEGIVRISLFITSFALYLYASFMLQKVCGLFGTFCLCAVTFSMWILIKYFLVDSIIKHYEEYVKKFMDEYPKEVREIYRKSYEEHYLRTQKQLLEEVQDFIAKSKNNHNSEVAKNE